MTLKKIYKCFSMSTNYPASIANALDKCAEEGFTTLETITYTDFSSIIIVVSKLAYVIPNDIHFTLTNELIDDIDKPVDPSDLLYQNTVDGNE